MEPRNASGEPCTEGRRVFVASVQDNNPSDGEVYAIDIDTGEVHWHVPLGGIHGEPLELWQNTVLVDTLTHCVRYATDSAGAPLARCAERRPGGVVGLDPLSGRERFRSTAQTDTLSSGWTAGLTPRGAWIHDGPSALRMLLPSVGDGGVFEAPRGRGSLGARALSLSALGDDLLVALDGRSTRIERRASAQLAARWSRQVPYRGRCAPVVVGPVMVLPGFESPGVSGAPRGFMVADGQDLWNSEAPPERVHGCGAAEGSRFWQSVDLRLGGREIADGRPRASFGLPGAPSSDMAVLVNGVFYLSFNDRVSGFDTIDGHLAVTVETLSQSSVGMVLWAGRAALATKNPGRVIGFD